MLKKGIRIFAAALAVVMVAGCSGGAQPTIADTPTQAAARTTPAAQPIEAQAAAATVAPESKPTPEPLPDFGGRTFYIGDWTDRTPTEGVSESGDLFLEKWHEVERRYNCKIEWKVISGDLPTAYITSVMAGDPIADMVYTLSHKVVPYLIEGGIVQPLNKLKNFDLDDPMWSPQVREATTYKGNTYSVATNTPSIRGGIFWNKTIFDQYGLPDLYDLVDTKQWTWDKMLEIALQGTVDTNKDGTPDIYGFGYNSNGTLPYSLIYSNGAKLVEQTDSGIKLDFKDSKIIESLSFFAKFCSSVTFAPKPEGSAWDWYITDFRDSRYAMFFFDSYIAGSYLSEKDGVRRMADEYGWVPLPMGPSATKYASYGDELSPYSMLNGVKDPEAVALIFSELYSYSPYEGYFEDMWISSLETSFDDAKSVKLLRDMAPNVVVGPIRGFAGVHGLVGSMFSEIRRGNLTPQSAIEQFSPQITAELEDINKFDYQEEMKRVVEEERAKAMATPKP